MTRPKRIPNPRSVDAPVSVFQYTTVAYPLPVAARGAFVPIGDPLSTLFKPHADIDRIASYGVIHPAGELIDTSWAYLSITGEALVEGTMTRVLISVIPETGEFVEALAHDGYSWHEIPCESLSGLVLDCDLQ